MKPSDEHFQSESPKTKRYIVTGPECSGKTTLAAALSKKLPAVFVPEIARDYLSNLYTSYTLEDVLKMAKLQYDAIINAPDSGSGIQICDTAMLEFKIWLADKFQYTDPFTEDSFDKLDKSYYLLCKPDIPFKEDPLREDPYRRIELFERYLAVLDDKKMLFTIIKGSLNHRMNTTMEIIEGQK